MERGREKGRKRRERERETCGNKKSVRIKKE